MQQQFFELSRDLHCLAGFDGFFKQVNSSFCRVLGYSEAELLSRPFVDFVHTDDIAATMAEVGRLSKGSHTVQFTNRYRKRDGEWCRLEWTAVPCLTEGLIYATARDAHDRQRAERAEYELEMARMVQQRLYPSSFPHLPALEAAGAVVPVDQLCGDCLDVVLTPTGDTVFVLGDVSGHGLPAALQMVELRSLLRVLLLHHDLGEALAEVRRMTLRDFSDTSFVTLFMARLDVNERLLHYVGAGHDGWLVHPNCQCEHLGSTALVLGLDDPPSEATSVQVASGDILLLTTDGVAEAGAAYGECFGMQRALDIVRRTRHMPVMVILQQLLHAVHNHVRESLTDDATVVVIKVL